MISIVDVSAHGKWWCIALQVASSYSSRSFQSGAALLREQVVVLYRLLIFLIAFSTIVFSQSHS